MSMGTRYRSRTLEGFYFPPFFLPLCSKHFTRAQHTLWVSPLKQASVVHWFAASMPSWVEPSEHRRNVDPDSAREWRDLPCDLPSSQQSEPGEKHGVSGLQRAIFDSRTYIPTIRRMSFAASQNISNSFFSRLGLSERSTRIPPHEHGTLYPNIVSHLGFPALVTSPSSRGSQAAIGRVRWDQQWSDRETKCRKGGRATSYLKFLSPVTCLSLSLLSSEILVKYLLWLQLFVWYALVLFLMNNGSIYLTLNTYLHPEERRVDPRITFFSFLLNLARSFGPFKAYSATICICGWMGIAARNIHIIVQIPSFAE